MVGQLVPGGILAGLWNVIDNRADWVAGLEQVSESRFAGWRPREVQETSWPLPPGRTQQDARRSPRPWE